MAAPVRMCRICRQRRPQGELVRLSGRPGRGLYACPEHAEIQPKKRGKL